MMHRLRCSPAPFFAVLAACVLTGCFPVKQYQSNRVAQFPLDPNASGPSGIQIPLGFIEFDDNGELFSREQLNNTIEKISALEKDNPATGINVVVFIHGWKNNASNASNNVAGFEAFLRSIYNYPREGGAPPPPLMGVYIGWRGARIRIAKDLSYWNGADATLRAAGPHLEEALYGIMRAVKPEERIGSLKAPGSKTGASNLILIGHSFGGRVLEKVMTPYLETLILADDRHAAPGCVAAPSQVKGRDVSGPLPTLTVLLNEAAPATDAKQFLDFLKCHRIKNTVGPEGQEKNYPLFLAITSDGDFANRVFLPIGQSAARLRMKTRPYCTGNAGSDGQSGCSGDPADPSVITNQSTYYTHTTASIPALYSHQTIKASQCPDGAVLASGPWRVGQDDYVLCSIPGAWNGTPYWVASIPAAMVPDHSDIFHEGLYHMLQSLIAQRLQRPKDHPSPQLRAQ